MAARRGTTRGDTTAEQTRVAAAARDEKPKPREAVLEGENVNEVRLVGRVSETPETRSLPSGDEVVQLRVVVRRPPEPAGKGAGAKAAVEKVTRASVDTIDVSCWTAMTRRAGLRMAEGDVVEVEGSLRRRFYRAGPSVQSRYDVVADRVRRGSPRA